MPRNAIEVYDPEIVNRQLQMEVRQKIAASGQKPQRISPDAPIFKMFAELAEKEAKRFREREEELRKRDPTFKPDALDFTSEPARAFDKDVDYYKILGVDELASSLEIKKAYMKRSLQLHPDKQVGKTEAEVEDAIDRFKALTEAYEILSDQPTRRQYDRERDKLAALRDQYGAHAGASSAPNPPTCVDVELSLEQLYRGVVKQVDFEQQTWAHWSQSYTTSTRRHRLRVHRGTLEGHTFWFKAEGHQRQGHARSDLVFVVQQAKHAEFERVGDDLWLYVREALPAEALLFARVVRTLCGGVTLAVGNTLAALVGFDRSGLGEAIVEGHGMPLRDDPYHPSATAATAGAASAAGAAGAAGAGAGASTSGSGSGSTHGDLVVRFPIQPPPTRRGPPRIELCGGGVPLPPIALVASPDGNGGPTAPMALEALVRHTVLPAIVHFAHRAVEQSRTAAAAARSAAERPASAAVAAGADEAVASEAATHAATVAAALEAAAGRAKASDALRGVWLRVGGSAEAPQPTCLPSACAAQVVRAVSSALPQLRWRYLHAAAGVCEPLLDDEVASLEAAAVIVLEAATDPLPRAAAGPTRGPGTPSSSAGAAPFASDASLHAVSGRRDEVAYTVAWRPGVRVRSAPAPDAPVVALLRHGARVLGAPPREGWVHLQRGGFALLRGPLAQGMLLRPEDESPVRTPAPPSSAAASPAAASPAAASPAAASPAAASLAAASSAAASPAAAAAEGARGARGAARSPAATEMLSAPEGAVEAAEARAAAEEAVSLAAEREEDAAVEREQGALTTAQLRALAVESVQGGCQGALDLMATPSLAAVYRSHCAGGVLIGVDRGCLLLGCRPSTRKPAANAQQRAAAARRRAAEDAAVAARIPVLPAWPALLPFALGLGDGPATDKPAWRRLRSAVHQLDVRDNGHGFAALGLPPGCVVLALSAQRFALRSVLGGAAPLKISRAEVDRDEGRRQRGRVARRAERERKERLAEMARLGVRHDRLSSSRPHQADTFGELRGACEGCDECTGWCQPLCDGSHGQLLFCCAVCGCPNTKHQSLSTTPKPK